MPLDNLNNLQTRKVNLGFLILFTLLALAVTIFLPFISFISLAVLPVPTALLVLSKRFRDAIICAIAGILLLFIFDYVSAIAITTVIVAISFGYRYFVDKDKSPIVSIIVIFFIFMGAIIIYIAISIAISRGFLKDIIKGYGDYVNNLPNDPLIKNYQALVGLSSEQFKQVLEQIQSILKFIPYLLPALGVVFLGIVSVINYYVSSIIFKRYNINIKQLPNLKYWDLQWYLCLGIIAGIILVIIPKFSTSFNNIIVISGYSLIIIFGILYLILGIAVIWGIFDRFNTQNSLRYIILALIVFIPGLMLLLPLLGLIDIWANFRKLNRS
jgi:uncharacterized protein YybS (DUF2232 family)